MSTPVRNHGGVEDSMLYTPRRSRPSQTSDTGAIVDPRASSPLIGGAPPTAPDIAYAHWGSTETDVAPPMAPGIGGPNIDPPQPRIRPFEGDIAVKDLRDRLSRDPQLAPEPPIAPSRGSVLPWVGRWLLVLGLAAGAGFGVRFVTLPHESLREGNTIVSTVRPLLDGIARPEPSMQPPRLVVESQRAFANEPLPLGISVDFSSGEETLTLVGLARGTTLTAGSPLGLTGWQLPARELGKTFAHAPKDFVGFMDAAIDLRSARDRLVDSQLVRLEWLPKKEAPRLAPRPPAGPTGDLQSLSPEEIASLIRHGEEFFKAGDVPSARIALRRAAQAGNARAALSLGATFDPFLLAEQGVIGFAPDPVQARLWYERAAELGAHEAPRRLERLAGR